MALREKEAVDSIPKWRNEGKGAARPSGTVEWR
jgi:hypothetical protein